jgi:hypothetical protein
VTQLLTDQNTQGGQNTNINTHKHTIAHKHNRLENYLNTILKSVNSSNRICEIINKRTYGRIICVYVFTEVILVLCWAVPNFCSVFHETTFRETVLHTFSGDYLCGDKFCTAFILHPVNLSFVLDILFY